MFSTLLLTSILIGAEPVAERDTPRVSYQRDIQPLLSDACYRCHGPDADSRKGGLRLDLRDAAVAPAESGKAAIVSGKPALSELIRRIESQDDSERMPPPDARRQLNASEIQRLRNWIAADAPFDQHWAFRPVRRPAVPEVRRADWCRTPIDRFVLAKLEENDLSPALPATSSTILRRISFGLTGLPPAPEETSALLNLAADPEEQSERFLQDAIENRLASVQYGEHWARHWMDLVRYADSAGYELDFPFRHSWRYRDWLIRSFCENKPADRFIQEQIAADELWPDSQESRDAVLFLAIGPRRFEGGIQRPAEREYEWFTDVTDTLGSAFLGLTLTCARCHDHKYDPVTQRDYFGLHAMIGDCRLQETKVENKGENSPVVLDVVRRDKPAVVQVLRRGEIDHPIAPAPAALPVAFSNARTINAEATPQTRAELAKWLTSADNPLTARVFVNRVWHWHFGKGLVRTTSDFGLQGERPSHPELLDWLAAELIHSGWDLNHLHRLILNSSIYRMSSSSTLQIQERDPDNRLLTRFPRRRLQAEELQDSLRFLAGQLQDTPYGQPVVPPLEEWALAGLRNANWRLTEDETGYLRRGVYMVVRRSMKLPFFDIFNGPDTVNSCAARDSTTIPQQALAMFNGPEVAANARSMADRLWTESRSSSELAARSAWLRLFGRAIRPDELQAAQQFLGSSDPSSNSAPDAWVEWTHLLLNSSEFSYVD